MTPTPAPPPASAPPEVLLNPGAGPPTTASGPTAPGTPPSATAASGSAASGTVPPGTVPPGSTPIEVHRRLPGYAPTPLVEADELARELGVGKLWVKDESSRFSLPSFKILGASYAIYREIARRAGGLGGAGHDREGIGCAGEGAGRGLERAGHDREETGRGLERAARDLDGLREAVAPLRPFTLAAATDGNHGRAVAHMARLLGFAARVYVPTGTADARIEAIRSEGATVEVVAGDYDAAIRRSARDEGERCAVISDTSWPGYERVPGWVIDGYSTIFREVDDALAERDEASPTLVVAPVGVGALATAAVRHYRSRPGPRPRILGVEPADAACVLASLRDGKPVTVPGPHRSIMAGLNCGTPSRIAWPELRRGLDAVVAIGDDAARGAMRALAGAGVISGETGAAALGGLRELRAHPSIASRWLLDRETRVLVLSTEGATDPAAYEQIVSQA